MNTTGVSGSGRVHDVRTSRETDRIELAERPGVSASRQGSIERNQMPGSYPRPPSPAPFKMSSALTKEAATLAKSKQSVSARQLSQRMQLEGRYLAERQEHADQTGAPEDAFISFAHIARELGLPNSIAEEIDQTNTQMSDELETLLKSSKPDQNTMQAMTGYLKSMLESQADLFASHAAHYEEVRQMPGLSPDDRANILRSELSFSAYATKTACDIPNMVAKAHEKASVIATSLKELGETDEAAQWETTAKELKTVQKDISSSFKTAVDQAKLPLLIQQYQDTSASWKNKGMAFIGQGARQAGLSGFALGAVRAFTLAGLEGNAAGQIFGAGLTTGIAHEVGTQLLAPAILEVIGGATRPINSAEVLPAPNRLVSVEGQIRKRSDAELQSATQQVKDLRLEHEQSKNANKTGSLPGEAKAWSFFAGVQGARAAITDDMDLTQFQEAGAVTLGSILAGFFMGGTHGADGLNAKMNDQFGRKLPAYTMKEQSDKPLPTRLNQIGSAGWANLDPFKTNVRKVYENKVASLSAGLAYAKALDPAIDAVANSNPAMKAGITGLATGVQSIMLLSQAWGGFGLGAQTAADKKAHEAERANRSQEEGGTPEPVGPRAYERTRTAAQNTFNPDREHYSHATQAGTLSRTAENMYTALQGVGEMVEAAVTDTLEDGPSLAIAGGGKIKEGIEGMIEARKRARPDSEPV